MEEVGNVQPKEVAPQQEPVVKKDGGSKGLIIGIIILTIVALAGIGFGVWGMMAKDKAEKNLANCSSNTSEDKDDGDVENESSDEPAECKTETANTENATNTVNSSDYIYVGEWGIKIKIPDNLERVSYRFFSWDNGPAAGKSLCVSGATTGHGDKEPSFVDTSGKESIACLSRNTRISTDKDDAWWNLVPVDQYYVVGPQDFMGDDDDKAWEQESLQAITEMLNNSSNRSAI